MAAPNGNKYWEFRKKHGVDKRYTTEGLEQEIKDYSEWVLENPLMETVVVAKGIKKKDPENPNGPEITVYTLEVPKMRAMTIRGFCLFADICEKTFANYRNNNDFVQVITRIEAIIYTQKFEGSSAGFLDPRIIARDLGLVDKTEEVNPAKNNIHITYK